MWTCAQSYALLSCVILLNLSIATGCGGMDSLAGEPPQDQARELEKSSGPGSKSDKPDVHDAGSGAGSGERVEEDAHVEDFSGTDTEPQEGHQEREEGDGGVAVGGDDIAGPEMDAREGGDGVDGIDAEGGLEGCALLCESMARCEGLPRELSVVECQIGCEVSRYDGSVTGRDIRCMERATSCGEVRFCINDLHGCDGACDAAMGCGVFEDGIDCYRWCGPQVLRGALTVSQMGCMEAVEREGRCTQFVDLCSLDGLP